MFLRRISIGIAVLGLACGVALAAAPATSTNPLLNEWTGPYGGEPPFEADANLDLAAEPEIVIDDIAEQAADDAGDGKADGGDDRRGLLRTLHGVVLGVIGKRPVAPAKGDGARVR